MTKDWDVFICHAFEDKEGLVRPLAVALKSLGVSVWFDEFSLNPGDSVSRSIDKGIANSRFGLVIISPAFLIKKWPEYELRGLVSREIAEDAVIIPVWHGVINEDVRNFSPSLSDKLAVITEGKEAIDVALQILKVVRRDLYDANPRAELARIASGEAVASLQEEIELLQGRLEPFECPTCGAPLSYTETIEHRYGDDLIKIFECGYQDDGRPCPSNPEFPKLEEFEFQTFESEKDYWVCLAIPKTAMARRLKLSGGQGRTQEEAKERLIAWYRRSAKPWPDRTIDRFNA
jgi:hypothetical protein